MNDVSLQKERAERREREQGGGVLIELLRYLFRSFSDISFSPPFLSWWGFTSLFSFFLDSDLFIKTVDNKELVVFQSLAADITLILFDRVCVCGGFTLSIQIRLNVVVISPFLCNCKNSQTTDS